MHRKKRTQVQNSSCFSASAGGRSFESQSQLGRAEPGQVAEEDRGESRQGRAAAHARRLADLPGRLCPNLHPTSRPSRLI
ncbi:hypothetical protein LDENG_00034410 [Lucifuga dentata]|nr:hypothetical protein LDENG_00034410 [Lucifuga dentata]